MSPKGAIPLVYFLYEAFFEAKEIMNTSRPSYSPSKLDFVQKLERNQLNIGQLVATDEG